MFINKFNFSKIYYQWEGKVHLPEKITIFYRYFIANILKSDVNLDQKEIFVHSWESHNEPRVVKYVDGMFCILENIFK